MVNGLNNINYLCSTRIIVNHTFSVISYYELFTYILSMVTLKSGIILDQNDDGPCFLCSFILVYAAVLYIFDTLYAILNNSENATLQYFIFCK